MKIIKIEIKKGGDNMISIYQKNNSITRKGIETKEMELRGLSTDTKPTEINDQPIANGSVFIETDTQKIYFFDEENQEWLGE